MLRYCIGRNFVLREETMRHQMTEEQVLQFELGQVLSAMGLRLKLAALRNDTVEVPDYIRVEVNTQLWDTDIRLYMESEHVVSAELS